jgi:hypothetical protein
MVPNETKKCLRCLSHLKQDYPLIKVRRNTTTQ